MGGEKGLVGLALRTTDGGFEPTNGQERVLMRNYSNNLFQSKNIN
jgi:hypothetical protein